MNGFAVILLVQRSESAAYLFFMIISHKHRFIFLKVQKTAGTSLEIALSEFCGPDDILTPLHPKDERIRREAGFRGAQNYYLPLSTYTPREIVGCLRRWGRKRYFNHSNAAAVRNHVGMQIWNSYFKFCFERSPYDKVISHYYWATSEPRPPIGEHLATTDTNYLSDWDIYTLNDEIAVDFIGRYETLENDLEKISARLNLPAIKLPLTKQEVRTDKRPYPEVLDSQARAQVEKIFAKELQAFGYRWEAD